MRIVFPNGRNLTIIKFVQLIFTRSVKQALCHVCKNIFLNSYYIKTVFVASQKLVKYAFQYNVSTGDHIKVRIKIFGLGVKTLSWQAA